MGNIVTKNVSLVDCRMEGAVVQVLRDWAAAFPDELVAFKRQMAAKRHALHDRGFSQEGHLREVGEIPAKLYHEMTHRFGPAWMRDKKLLGHFMQNFKIGQTWVGHHEISRV